MELDKQTFGLLFGALVIIFLWLKFRNPYSGSKDRRKEERRAGMKDRRVDQGRRTSNQLTHESKLRKTASTFRETPRRKNTPSQTPP
jgi:hypothetical protein